MLEGIFAFCILAADASIEECFNRFETQVTYFCPGDHEVPHVNTPSDGAITVPDGRVFYFGGYADGPSQRYFVFDPDTVFANDFGRCQAEASGR